MDHSVQRNVKYLKLNGSKKSHDQRFFLIFGNLGTQIGDKTFACSNLLTNFWSKLWSLQSKECFIFIGAIWGDQICVTHVEKHARYTWQMVSLNKGVNIS